MKGRVITMTSLLLIASIVTVGCGEDVKEVKVKMGAGTGAMEQNAPQAGENAAEPKAPIQRRIIFNASINLQVKELDAAEQTLRDQAEQLNATVVEHRIEGTKGQQRTGTFKVRVPVDQFDAFRRAILGLGEVRVNSTDSEDVTAKYVDLETRLRVAKAAEEELLAMREKAIITKDWRELHADLKAARTEVESLEGTLRLLKDLTARSTVTVTMTETGKYDPPGAVPFGTRLGRAFSDSVQALQDFGKACVVAIVAVAPWLPLIGLVLYPIWRETRRRRRGRQPVGQAVPDEPKKSGTAGTA